MSVSLTINGVAYPFPVTGDQNWGAQVTAWATAVTSGMLQKAGGTFTLTADVNFGSSFGLLSAYFTSVAANAAAAGAVRLARSDTVSWRNQANGADLPLGVDASNQLTYNGVAIATSAGVTPVAAGGTGISSYTIGDTLYASAAAVLSKLAIGAANKVLTSTGTAPAWNLLVNANIDAAAAIAYSKLALTGAILNADLAGSIAYSKLTLTNSIVNADIGAAAAIAYSKLSLTGSILNADINASAAIALSKTDRLFPVYADFTEQASTPSVPAASTRRLYFKTDGKLYQEDSSGVETQVGGSSAGGINYITNSDAETNVTGWTMYADAAGTSPVDGTGGSPSSTITRVTSSPLRGVGMFRLTKSAANRQGEGVSYDFTIAAADKAKPLSISFEYNPSANFVAGDSSDVRVFIYDVTNAALIGVAPYTIQGGSGANQKFIANFQSASNSTSYRLIFHIATTNATAWTFDFDTVIVGPQMLNYGAPISDWVTYTAVHTGNGSATDTLSRWRRVGGNIEIESKWTSGTGTAVEARLSLPTGITSADTSLIPSLSVAGVWVSSSNGAVSLFTLIEPSVTYITFGIEAAGSNSLTKCLGNSMGDSATFVAMATFPVQGWGSNVAMSNDTDTRVVSMRADFASTTINNTTPLVVNTVRWDTHGAYSAGTYTVPVSGKYKIDLGLRLSAVAFTAGQVVELYLYKNGSQASIVHRWLCQANGTYTVNVSGSDMLDCVPGDTIQCKAYSDASSAASGAAGTYFTVTRMSGPSAIAATETVAARATTSVTNSASGIVVFTAKTYDTHGGFDTGTGRYTCPTSGKYSVKAAVSYSNTAFSAGATESISLYKNAVQYSQLAYHQVEAAKTELIGLAGSDEIQCLAGDILDIRTIGSAVALDGSAINNFVCISRIGNY